MLKTKISYGSRYLFLLSQMPERNFEALDIDRRKKAVEYVPGYDWIPEKFGPPPGIAKARKDEFGLLLLVL